MVCHTLTVIAFFVIPEHHRYIRPKSIIRPQKTILPFYSCCSAPLRSFNQHLVAPLHLFIANYTFDEA